MAIKRDWCDCEQCESLMDWAKVFDSIPEVEDCETKQWIESIESYLRQRFNTGDRSRELYELIGGGYDTPW